MKTLKNINRNEQSLDCSSLTPGRVQCEEDVPYFNSDYFSYVIVQTLKERDNIPCKLRQNGMIAIVIEERFAEYQLQTSLSSGICNNTSWKRIRDGHQNYDSSNLFLFKDITEVDLFLKTPDAKAGQMLYVITENKYYRVSKNKTLEDPFLEKLNKPSEITSEEYEDFYIAVYKEGLPPMWKSYSDFGKVHTVNGNTIDKNKNISLGIDDIFRVGVPKEESTDKMLESNKRILLYDPDTNISYWKNISKFSVGDFSTEDNTLKITDTRDIFINYNDVREDIVIKKPFKFPLQITLFNLFNEFSQVIVNEKVLSKKAYFIFDQNNIQLNKKVKDIVKEDDSELRVIVLGKKFLNNKNN